MRMSCKLSNTAIAFIESEGLDPTDFLMELPWSDSQLLDPGQNLPIAEMESFFSQYLNWWQTKKGPIEDIPRFLKSVGRSSLDSRSWGTLDSVLRMMPDVFEVWQRPSKLLGHFVDPEPIVADLIKDRKQVRFSWPQAPYNYSQSFLVLMGCLEVLPKYMGDKFAHCFFDQGTFYFDLSPVTCPAFKGGEVTDSDSVNYLAHHETSNQLIHLAGQGSTRSHAFSMGVPVNEVALSNEEALFHSLSLSPEAFREMVAVVEKPHGPNRRAKQRVAHDGPEQLTLHAPFGETEPEIHLNVQDANLESLQQNLSRIVDFFIRATQLVKLMSQQNPEKAKKWMRRLNWEKVQEEFPGLVEESVTLVKQLKSSDDRN